MGFMDKLLGLDPDAQAAVRRLEQKDITWARDNGMARDSSTFSRVIDTEINFRNLGKPNAIDKEIQRVRR